MKRKLIGFLLTLALVASIIPANTLTASAATNVAFPTLSSSAYCEFVASKNMNVYKDSACTTRGTSSPALAYNALITTGDTCQILKITDAYINLKYPTSSGLRTGYIKRSTLIGVSAPHDKITAQGKATTNTKAASASYGYTEKGDIVYQLGASGNYTQIIYAAKSGSRAYKLGYVLKSDYTSKICAPKITATSPYTLAAGKTGTINLTFSGSGIDSVGGSFSGSGLSSKINSVTWGATSKVSISVTATSACTGGSIVFQLKNKTFGVIQSKTIQVKVTPTPTATVATPAKVTGVTAASASYSSVKVSWAKATNATGYEVYRAASSTGTYSKVGTVTSGSTLSYTNTGLATGTKYYYKVRASRTVSGTTVYGSFSDVVSAAPVLAKVAGAQAASAGSTSAKVSWGTVSGASGYEVYRATSSAGTYAKVGTVTSGSTLSYTNTGLTSGKVYYYKVRAYRTVSATKVYGAYSAIVNAKPVPAKVGSAKAASASTTSIKVSWGSVSGASGYEVYRATTSAGAYSKVYTATSGSTLNYTNKSLTKGKAYYYKVRAYRTVSGVKVYGAYSAVVNAKPGAVSNLVWQYPLKNAKCSWSGYKSSTWSWSEERNGNPNATSRTFHLGLDLTGSTTVYPALEGTVVAASSSNQGANGRYVIIKHKFEGKTVYSFYAHLSSVSVKTNQAVTKSTKIGVVGGSGYGSNSYYGAHLHFAIVNTLWSNGAYYGYAYKFTGNSKKYDGVTYYNPRYVISKNQLP